MAVRSCAECSFSTNMSLASSWVEKAQITDSTHIQRKALKQTTTIFGLFHWQHIHHIISISTIQPYQPTCKHYRTWECKASTLGSSSSSSSSTCSNGIDQILVDCQINSKRQILFPIISTHVTTKTTTTALTTHLDHSAPKFIWVRLFPFLRDRHGVHRESRHETAQRVRLSGSASAASWDEVLRVLLKYGKNEQSERPTSWVIMFESACT